MNGRERETFPSPRPRPRQVTMTSNPSQLRTVWLFGVADFAKVLLSISRAFSPFAYLTFSPSGGEKFVRSVDQLESVRPSTRNFDIQLQKEYFSRFECAVPFYKR